MAALKASAKRNVRLFCALRDTSNDEGLATKMALRSYDRLVDIGWEPFEFLILSVWSVNQSTYFHTSTTILFSLA